MSNTSIKLDEIDKKILSILQKNAKITNAQLSNDIGLSPAPTLERVRKLEQTGVIKSYHARINHELLGINIGVFVQVSFHSHSKNDILSFVQKINLIPEIIECYHVTGSSDILLKVLAKDIANYHEFLLSKLVDIEEIGKMESLVILANYKQSPVFQIE
ncbi:MAG: Lrp/AsnC family transcriptional regulator [Cytophagales bacterium]|nr:MAG: Lrp/AsnC family transcriptional regulator [Cytophagales bacterium]